MHNIKAAVVVCIDYRFHDVIYEFLKIKNYLGNCDIISLAGSSRDLCFPINETDREQLLRQLSISVKLHQPDKIILIDHQDCGGYAIDGKIPGGLAYRDDFIKHREYLNLAINILKSNFPDIKYESYYADLKKNITPVDVTG